MALMQRSKFTKGSKKAILKSFAFKKIDAFATGQSGGNPAGAIYLQPNSDMSAQEMQQIAGELKGFVNEVGYVRQIDDTTFDLKYYSSEKEVEFCGHATIAIMYDLMKNNDALMDIKCVTIVTRKGRLTVENRTGTEHAVFISAPSPVFLDKKVEKALVSAALRVDGGALDESQPVSIVNAGLETLVVPIKDLNTLLSLSPEFRALKRFCQEQAIDVITVFTDDVADRGNAYRTRVFAPPFGYLEDPATGSGNAALGYYLLKNQRWDGRPISLEQNSSLDKPNIVKLTTTSNEKKEMIVVFGGGAVTRIQGEYFLS